MAPRMAARPMGSSEMTPSTTGPPDWWYSCRMTRAAVGKSGDADLGVAAGLSHPVDGAAEPMLEGRQEPGRAHLVQSRRDTGQAGGGVLQRLADLVQHLQRDGTALDAEITDVGRVQRDRAGI